MGETVGVNKVLPVTVEDGVSDEGPLSMYCKGRRISSMMDCPRFSLALARQCMTRRAICWSLMSSLMSGPLA